MKLVHLIWLIVFLNAVSFLSAHASGACCSVSPGGKNKTSIALIGSTASSHERIGGIQYDLKQQALMARGSLPITEHLFVGGTVGLPIRTSLSAASGTSSGSLGMVYGIGAGAVLPEILSPVNFVLMLNYTRSEGKLSSSSVGKDQDAHFVISEIQGVIVGEVDIVSEIAVYGGGRFYSGANKIRDNRLGKTDSGEREGNVSPFFGVRGLLSDELSLIAEGSLGHTRVLSLALIASL